MRQNSLVKEKTIEAARKRIPFFVHLDLTYQCNLECAHCYVVKENRPEMTTSKIKKLLEELADMGTLYLQLSGGEIFLRKDFFEIAEYARKLHFALRISTNGTLIDEKTADKIASLYPERVSISVYSTNPQVHDRITGVNGSLENTINCARLLLERNVGV